MINKETARRLVLKHLSAFKTSPPMGVAILDEHTIETEFGWVFLWNSKLYRDTGEFKYALAGNAPIIVDKQDGSLHETSTAYAIEEIVENYRKSHPRKPSEVTI